MSILFLLVGCVESEGPLGLSGPPLQAAMRATDFTDSRLEAPELVQGRDAPLIVEGLPAGATVYYFGSDQGEGVTTTPWMDLDLEGARLLGTATADGDGRAVYMQRTTRRMQTGSLLLQAVAACNGLLLKTRVILRNITVPREHAAAQFEDVTESAGLGLMPMTGNSHTGGAAWVDINNDYWPDLFVTNGAGLPHYLYRNNGDGTFTDVSDRVLKPDVGLEDAGVSFADLENDGDLDILVAVDHPAYMAPGAVNVREGGPNLLYINDGHGYFTEDAGRWGVIDSEGRRTIEGIFADIDRDGFVDLYMDTWAMNYQVGVYDHTPTMLLNEEGTVFEDITDQSGLDDQGRDALVALFFDVNEDGWPDLYQGNVSVDFEAPYVHQDGLYVNDGAGGFVDEGASWPGYGDDAGAAMGADVGDVDGDGHYDLYITDIFDRTPEAGFDPLPAGNVLYRGNGEGTLEENSCDTAGVCSGYIGWPTNFADFDRDGWVDLWVGNSRPTEPEMLFWNRGDGTFEHHFLGLLREQDAHGGSVADYDGDGAMDIFVQSRTQPSMLLRNEAVDGHHYVALRLFGVTSNWAAIGADITVETADGLVQRRRVSGGDSAHSQQDLTLHVGIGSHTEAEVTVTWPSGSVEPLGVLPADVLSFAEEGVGVWTETLTSSEVVYDAGQLTVTVQSRFGGRTALEVVGYGELAWDPEQLVFGGTFEATELPEELTVVSERGGTFLVHPE